MSGPLAIATVTAVLKDLLNDGLVNSDLSASWARQGQRAAAGPHRHRRRRAESAQRVPLPGDREPGLAQRGAAVASSGGDQRLSNPPLALDLHYLLTAYGAQDLDAEILLGYAMQLLHETPVLTRRRSGGRSARARRSATGCCRRRCSIATRPTSPTRSSSAR